MPKGPVSTVISGGLAGCVVAALTNPIATTRQFPETMRDRKLIVSDKLMWNTLRLAASHAVFFTAYTGMKEGINKSRIKTGQRTSNRDHLDMINEFMAGGISGLCYRATSLGFQTAPLLPIPAMVQLQRLGITFLTTATAVTFLESFDYLVKGN
jgi:hypothetical protein